MNSRFSNPLPLMIVFLISLLFIKQEAVGQQSHHNESEKRKQNCDMAVCNEKYRQSPINLSPLSEKGRHSLTFNYVASQKVVENTGHTVKLSENQGSRLQFDGVLYDLVQFHFHTPSEHRIGQKPFDMEMHLVHQSADSAYLVVEVMFRVGEENAFLRQFIKDIPKRGKRKETMKTLDLAEMIPKKSTGFLYGGSLTTAPFTEGVRWVVLEEPETISKSQLTLFQSIEGFNARALQAVNERKVEAFIPNP